MSATTMSNPAVSTSLRPIARIAGVLYLIIIVAGMFAGGYARPSLLVPGDAAATATNIMASEGLLRASIVADLAMIMADVAIGIAFYYLLKPVNQGLSLLSAVFRLAQAATLGINLLMLFLVLQLLSGADYLTILGTEQIHAQALLFLNAHSIGYKLALMFFAFSILIQGYLLYVSSYFPKILGVLVIVASLGYFVDNMATFILPNYDAYAGIFEMIVMVALPVELILALWLLVKGISVKQPKHRSNLSTPHAELLSH
ncbi:MAG: DUF4386 domain-containing protein [Anaerolineae bacterium]|nr:DUF4386 domain-containing protein [Anaerolineae bacterium]